MIRVVTENGRHSPYTIPRMRADEDNYSESAVTKDRITTRIVWLALYAALFSAVAFAGSPALPEQDRASLSPIDLDARPIAMSVRPVTSRLDI